MNYGTEVTLAGRVIMRSRNLRGMRDYARRSPVATVNTKRRAAHANDPAGILEVTYADGATSHAEFASHEILIDFVRNRRSWRGAVITHHDGELGYLTKPGLIAGT